MNKAASFPKSCRLLSPSDFASLRRDSLSIQGSGFRFVYKAVQGRVGRSRLGMAVSSKVGKANYRNKIKRVVRESFRKRSFSNSYDILFIPNSKISIMELSDELGKAFEKF